MTLCQKCQSIPDTAVAYSGRPTVVRHDTASLKRSIQTRCFICTRVWESLSEEQKTVAESPTFTGIQYQARMSTGWMGEKRENPILASLICEPGDDLYDCEDYNVVGGWWRMETGQFSVLNPSSMSIK